MAKTNINQKVNKIFFYKFINQPVLNFKNKYNSHIRQIKQRKCIIIWCAKKKLTQIFTNRFHSKFAGFRQRIHILSADNEVCMFVLLITGIMNIRLPINFFDKLCSGVWSMWTKWNVSLISIAYSFIQLGQTKFVWRNVFNSRNFD